MYMYSNIMYVQSTDDACINDFSCNMICLQSCIQLWPHLFWVHVINEWCVYMKYICDLTCVYYYH